MPTKHEWRLLKIHYSFFRFFFAFAVLTLAAALDAFVAISLRCSGQNLAEYFVSQ